MRVCLEKSTGILIEMQTFGRKGTLIENAVNSGYSEKDIEEKEVTEEEYQVILDNQPKPIEHNIDMELEEAIENATTLEELKSALLGRNRNAKVKGKFKEGEI